MIRLLLLLALFPLPAWAGDKPPEKGLSVWLDVSDQKTLTVDPERGVLTMKNKGSAGGEARARGTTGAWLIENCLGGLPNLRFTGPQSYVLKDGLKELDEATVFIVFRRNDDMVGGAGWQRLLTSGEKKEGLYISFGAESDVYDARVVREVFPKVQGLDLFIGADSPESPGNLRGDIAEILVYDRTFYVEDQMREVVAYLTRKWGFTEKRGDEWTRVGPLGDKIERKFSDRPLSDQENKGGWALLDTHSDEFEGERLDDSKWWDHHPTWFGRPPGRFLPSNVSVTDGELQLTMRKDESLKDGDTPLSSGYHTYSSALVTSKTPVLYGYFEIDAKPMASAGSSAFWLAGTAFDKEKDGWSRIEIDVFELGGKTPKKEKSYNMNLHVFRTPGEKRHWNSGDIWQAPFRLRDDFHVYGLEWGKEFVRYFVDGHLVRELKNTHCHSPMAVLMDSETMFDWLGVPEDSDLPSTYRIKYVRTWKNPETTVEWKDRYQIKIPHPGTNETQITKLHRGK